MKKKIVFALMALMTLSMLFSSFARAQSIEETQRCTAETQIENEILSDISADHSKLATANTQDERADILADIQKREAELKITEKNLSTCPQ